jgi:hypothetical protein
MPGAVMPNAQQIAVIDAILSIFETGTVTGSYGSVVFSPNDKGQLTYGKHQTTLTSGNLATLIQAYVDAAGAKFAGEMKPFLPALKAHDPKLNFNTFLKNLLRAAADDQVMRDVQDEFFIEVYRKPALTDGKKLGLTQPLSWCIRYDGQVHGSWGKIADQTNAEVGKISAANERDWMSTYVSLRRQWLANGDGDLPKTVYRMDAIRNLMDIDAWDLAMPLVVRDLEISTQTLAAPPPGVYSGPQPRSRVLDVATPIMLGLDVRLAQLALSRPGVGFDVAADGKFGKMSKQIVSDFQTSRGLPATGKVDVATFAALGL